MNLVICYDISDNRKRRKVYKVLESYGIRTQFSIFELTVSNMEYNAIKEKLLNLIDLETDRLYFFALCESCIKKIERNGNIERFKIEEYNQDVIII
ncbi:MAG: CRISPR-associated endonuclease Cas2 [Candidatus Muirbacterium halophilum]|nr:CRISPR-associated endonuclease Cas2 [Candidatus Muirbacterium halophilum]